jgi:hypothetical protein
MRGVLILISGIDAVVVAKTCYVDRPKQVMSAWVAKWSTSPRTWVLDLIGRLRAAVQARMKPCVEVGRDMR